MLVSSRVHFSRHYQQCAAYLKKMNKKKNSNEENENILRFKTHKLFNLILQYDQRSYYSYLNPKCQQ